SLSWHTLCCSEDVTHVRRRWIWTLIAVGAALTIALVLFISAVPLKSDILKDRMIASLSERLNGDVSLDALTLRVFPRLHAVGNGLVIRRRGRPGVPPLIAIKDFVVDADLLGVWRKHVAFVRVNGLDISIPPDEDDNDDDSDHSTHSLHGERRPAAPDRNAAAARPPDDAVAGGVAIDTLETSDARLIIVPREAGKQPKVWAIHALTMHDVSGSSAMPFQATLTNGVPPGEIITSGRFGPWARHNP